MSPTRGAANVPMMSSKSGPRASLEAKVAQLVRAHAEDGPPWRPADLARELEELIDAASAAELRVLESLGAALLLSVADRPDGPPV